MEEEFAGDLIPECDICSIKYDTYERVPLNLPCTHTFCKSCMH